MRHDRQVSLLRQVIERLDNGTNVDAGGVRRNPTSVYVDPELAAREREAFFRHHPQMVGRSGDLPEPGSFFTVDELHVPIIATATPTAPSSRSSTRAATGAPRW